MLDFDAERPTIFLPKKALRRRMFRAFFKGFTFYNRKSPFGGRMNPNI